jgi:hypothetical protein
MQFHFYLPDYNWLVSTHLDNIAGYILSAYSDQIANDILASQEISKQLQYVIDNKSNGINLAQYTLTEAKVTLKGDR